MIDKHYRGSVQVRVRDPSFLSVIFCLQGMNLGAGNLGGQMLIHLFIFDGHFVRSLSLQIREAGTSNAYFKEVTLNLFKEVIYLLIFIFSFERE